MAYPRGYVVANKTHIQVDSSVDIFGRLPHPRWNSKVNIDSRSLMANAAILCYDVMHFWGAVGKPSAEPSASSKISRSAKTSRFGNILESAQPWNHRHRVI
jgi:hypothetical protein